MINVSVKHNKVSTNRIENKLGRLIGLDWTKLLRPYAEMGVKALSEATPVDTGKTAASWTYDIEQTEKGYVIHWINTNVNKHVNVAIILQNGHYTGTKGWVEGRDYINPALQPVLNMLSKTLWEEVIS